MKLNKSLFSLILLAILSSSFAINAMEQQEKLEILMRILMEESRPAAFLSTYRDSNNNTLLHLTAQRGCIEQIELILSYYNDHEFLNCQNNDGNTALHIALTCVHGFLDNNLYNIAKTLLKAHTNTDIQNKHGLTSRYIINNRILDRNIKKKLVSLLNTISFLDDLTKQMPKPDLMNKLDAKERTCLHTATVYESLDEVEVILQYQKNPEFLNFQNENGCTALHIATSGMPNDVSYKIAKALIKVDADSNILNNDEQRPIDLIENNNIIDESLKYKFIRLLQRTKKII